MNSRFLKFEIITLFILMLSVKSGAQIDYKTKLQTIWSNRGCIGCHGGSGGFYIDTYNSLITTGDHKPLVVSKDTNSILVQKLKGTANFGSRMPIGGPYLPESEMRTIIQWIKEGATENPTTSTRNDNLAFINKFILDQNYPNPFNPLTMIKFEIPNPSLVSLKIYNFSGQEVANLINDNLTAGKYEREWNAKGFSSGVYYIVLRADNFNEMRKMLLTK